MVRLLFSSGCALILFLGLAAGRASAENEGQPELDKATQLKLGANTTSDLTDVIQLCDQAIKKGLDKANTSFAKNLLASTLVQRGSTYANKAFRSLLSDGNWQQDRKDALADLEKGISLNPKQPQALYLIARLGFLPRGDAKRAAEALDQTIAQSDDDPPLRAEALILRASVEKDSAKRMADLDAAVLAAPGDSAIYRARGAVRADMDKLDEAIGDFDKAISIDPNQISAYQLKAMALVKQQKFTDALAVLDKAGKIAPDNIDVPFSKARIFTQQSNFKAAMEELNRAAAVDPNNLSVLLLRGAIYQELGEKEKSLADFDKILALKPKIPTVMRDRAILLAQLGKLDEAATQLEQLRKADPKDPVASRLLGALYTMAKQYEKAAEAYTAVIAERNDDWEAFRGRGDARLNLGHRAEAISDYDRALTFRPKDAGILNNLSWVLATAPEAKLRDGKRALVLAIEACNVTNYREDYILSTLAAAYAETGDFANALKWAAKAVELATKEHRDDLENELKSYKAGKPWREALPAPSETKNGKKPEPKSQPKPPAVKQEPATKAK